MEIRVLGDLTIDGGPLSPKERSLLAVLVLRNGQIATPSELADAVWGDDVPDTWPKQVQAGIGHIRRALGTSSVETSRGGYRLRLEAGAIDAAQFERLLVAARTHRADGDPARAIDAIRRALALWFGEPYADLGDWPPALTEAERLKELRSFAEEELLEAELDHGEHRAVVADAERLVRSSPLRERRWALLATALYRSGRQADALATLRRARERLAEELGIEPGGELAALASAILRQELSLDAPPPPPLTSAECPYRGLRPFGTDDADEFFGRDDDIRAALARLARSPFLAVSGPSGCGKSSLVLAGIVPALRARGHDVVVLGSGGEAASGLREALFARAGADVIIIDQFEEVFHLGLPEGQVAELCDLIADAVVVGRSIVLVVRSDFLDECTRQRSIASLFAEGVHLVGPLTPAGLRRAIEEPARLAGLRLEAGLAELLLRDAAGEPGALPHISHALVETWLRREGPTLTVAGYEDSGGISGAIAQSADRLYQSMDATQRELCRSMMLRLVTIGADGIPTRRRIAMKSMREDVEREHVIARLAGARLVSAEQSTLVISHESLATAWPLLRRWLEEDAENAKTMNALAAAAEAWDADARPDDELYGGLRLQTALQWREAWASELTGLEAAFLDASSNRAHAAADELAERARHDRSQNRKLRALLVAAVALFTVAVTAGGFVAIGAAETARERTTAQIEALVSTSLALRSTERDVAALLAAEAYHRWPEDPRTRSALMGVMQAANGLMSTTYVPGVREMSGRVIPGTRLAAVVTDSHVAVYDLDTAELIRTLDIPRSDIFTDTRLGPAISADGRRVAVAELTWPEDHLLANGSVLFVADVATGARTLGPVEFDVPLSTVAISPDGGMVAIIDIVGVLRLVDADSGRVRTVATGAEHDEVRNSDRAGTLAFTNNGTLLYGTVGGLVLLIDPASGTLIDLIQPPNGSTNVSMTVVSDALAVMTGDDHISAVNPMTRTVLWSRELERETLEPCPWIAATESRGTIYCGDLWGRIEERSLATGVLTGRRFDPQLSYVGPLSLSADGGGLDVVGRGAPAFTRWRLDGSGPATRIIAPGSVVRDIYSATGSLLFTAVAPAENTQLPDAYTVVDTRTGEAVFRTPPDWRDMGWTGDGLLIGLHDDDQLGLMSVRTGDDWPLDFPELNFLTASTDGRKLYASKDNGDGKVFTLDATTGEKIGPTFQLSPSLSSVSTFIQSVSTNADASSVLITQTNTKDEIMTSLFDGRTGELIRSGTMGRTTLLTSRGEIISLTQSRITRYDAESFERTGSLPGVPGGFARITVSNDGRTLSAFAVNGTVSIYDLVHGIRLGDPIPVAFPDIWAGFIRPDGRELAVNAADGIAIWDLDPEAQARAACRVAGRDLTHEEWNTYLGRIGGYHSTCGFTAG